MKKKITINLILYALLIIFCSAQCFAADFYFKNTKAPISTINVINIYPHDPEAFTQGLFYRNGFLYESTGLLGTSTLRKVDLVTGNILDKIKLSENYFGEGITYLNNKIYQLTWKNKRGFIYDFRTFKKTTEFNYDGEGWGITADDKYLYMSNGTAVISCLDPKTLKIIRKINVHDGQLPVININELELINGEIWANVFMESVLVRVSPITGKVLGWVDLSPLYNKIPKYYSVDVLNGIAYDRSNNRIFVTGKYWPHIFEIKLASQH
ncbi:MAG: glutaminyl-peptide cyclotransferase [Syntrophaceae bacterium]|nr:glutaminyl-peptide cyclotransferase [Syntrophaceae bacterium]